jgi:hypothetical protein
VLEQFGGVQANFSVAAAQQWLLEELLGDFPFVDTAGPAHTLAALFERFVRPLICGPTPLYLIDAPAQGTGKGLLADVVSRVVMGVSAPVMALTRLVSTAGSVPFL